MLPKIETILYCTGMGPNAPHVFRYAYTVARRFGARITVLHVIETLSPRQRALVEGYSGKGTLSDLLQRAEEEAATILPQRIEEFCARETPDDDWRQTVGDIVVVDGHVADQILRHQESTAADLVVIGVHGASSLSFGSTARRLVKECPVPVLTVQVPEG